AGRHLSVHHQAFALQLAEMLPRRPATDEIAVGDENTRRAGVRSKHSDRFAALHEQRLVVAEIPELAHDCVEAIPVARCFPRSTVYDEIRRSLGDIRIEIVHQQPERRFLLPALAGDVGPARRAHRSALAGGSLERFWIVLHAEIGHVTVPMSAKRSSETAV